MDLKLEGKGKKTVEVVVESPFDGFIGLIIRLIAVLVSWFLINQLDGQYSTLSLDSGI